MRLNSPRMTVIYNACMKASKSLIRDFGEIEKLQVSTKGPGDFVTAADKRTEKIIIEELLKAHPNYGILSEEVGEINKENVIRNLEKGYEYAIRPDFLKKDKCWTDLQNYLIDIKEFEKLV